MTHPCVTSYDAPPPINTLIIMWKNFPSSNDLLLAKNPRSFGRERPPGSWRPAGRGWSFRDGRRSRPFLCPRQDCDRRYRGRMQPRAQQMRMGWVRQGGEGYPQKPSAAPVEGSLGQGMGGARLRGLVPAHEGSPGLSEATEAGGLKALRLARIYLL